MTVFSMQVSCHKASINRLLGVFYKDDDTYDTNINKTIFTGGGVRDAWLDCPEKYFKSFYSKSVTSVILIIFSPVTQLNWVLLDDTKLSFLSYISIGSIN